MPHQLEKAVEELAQGLILVLRGAERLNHVLRHDAPRSGCPWCPLPHGEVLRLVE